MAHLKMLVQKYWLVADIWPLNLGNPRLGGGRGGGRDWAPILDFEDARMPKRALGKPRLRVGVGGRPKMPILDFQD